MLFILYRAEILWASEKERQDLVSENKRVLK